MVNTRHRAAKRAADASSLRPAAVQVDQLRAPGRAQSSLFKATAVTSKRETLVRQMYRPCRAGLLENRVVEHRGHTLHAVSSAELCW